MSDDLKPMLKLLLDALQSSTDFAIAQAPLILREMIWWGIGSAIFRWVFWWAIAISAYVWLRPVVLKIAAPNAVQFESEAHITTLVFRGVCGVVLLASAGGNAYVLIKIAVAPRLYLIERIGEILNGK